MNEDDTARTKGFVDKAAGMRHPYEEILIRVILNWDTEVPYTRVRMFGRDGFGANRNNMCNATFCQRTSRLCRDETKGADGEGHGLSHETGSQKGQKGKY
jgi:hypothetical protein